MNFRFYGDSWFWTWWPEDMPFKSEQVNNLRARGVSVDSRATYPPGPDPAISFVELYLNKLGHEVEQFCHPGNAFCETVATICSRPAAEEGTANIVFYSEPTRGVELRVYMEKECQPDLTYDMLEDKLYEMTVVALCRLGKHANEINQEFIISGGQSTLYDRVMTRVPEELRKNLTLLHPCILSSTDENYDRNKEETMLGPFKLTECIGYDAVAPVNWENYHNTVPERIHFQLDHFDENTKAKTWPDIGHMNPGHALFYIDDLLYYLEGK
jgi:hypothetical protein|tara:strand:- start:34 stop:843 length:810 start_codon:yes stop_codon:yes gene_type:complete